MYIHIFFIHSSVDRHLGCLHILATISSTDMGGVHISFFFFFFFHTASRILVPHSRMESVPPTVEGWSPKHWTARELPACIFLS